MGPLLVALCLSAPGTPGPVLRFPAAVTDIAVPAEPNEAAVTFFDGGSIVAWADGRRDEWLARSPLARDGTLDVWLRYETGTPMLACRDRMARRPRLAASRDAIGLVTSGTDEFGPFVSFAQLPLGAHPDGGLCGLQIEHTPGRPELTALASSFTIGWLEGIALHSGDPTVPSSFSSTNPGVADNLILTTTAQGSLVTAFRVVDGGTLVWPQGGSSFTVAAGADAYALVPLDTTSAHVAWRVGNSVSTRVVGASGPVQSGPVAALPPLLADIPDGGGVLLVVAGADGGTSVERISLAAARAITPVSGAATALATSGLSGRLVVQHAGGPLGVSRFQLAPGFDAPIVPSPQVITTARALQRRPSVVWSPEERDFLLAWDEATTANRTAGRIVRLTAGTAPVSTPPWPRLVGEVPDASVGVLTTSLTGTTVAVWSDGGLISSTLPDTPADLIGATAGAEAGFGWTEASRGVHNEHFLREVNPVAFLGVAGAVLCAASLGGTFSVVRQDTDGGLRLTTHSEAGAFLSSRPLESGMELGCITARPQSRLLGTALSRANVVAMSDTGGASWFTTVDAGVRSLRVVGLPSGWFAVFSTSAGIYGATFDEAEGGASVIELVSSHPRARGEPVVAASPAGEVAVAWPELIGDSVVISARVVTTRTSARDAGVDGGSDPTQPDGGVPGDAGATGDGGTIGDRDAGATGDGGAALRDGGLVGVEFTPACGCATDTGVLGVVGGLVLLLARRRRE